MTCTSYVVGRILTVATLAAMACRGALWTFEWHLSTRSQRRKGAVCAQAYSFFDKNVNLGADFTSGEVYPMNVNEKTTSFVMQ